jgi:hypothetical protein
VTQEPLEWKPRGYPVRWALGATTTIAVVCAVSIWFGIFTPRVESQPLSWGPLNGEAGMVELRLELTNQAHTDARLLDIGESLPGMDRQEPQISTSQDGPPDNERHMAAGGGKLWVTLQYRVTDCAAVPHDPPAIPMTLRTPVGLRRTIAGIDDLGPDYVPWTTELVSSTCG